MVNYKQALRALTHSITSPEYGPDLSVQRAYLEVAEAVEKAVEAGVDPLWLAEALAGGEEVAAGNLLVHRAGVDDPDVGHYKYANVELFEALTPSVRASFFLSLPNILTEAEWNEVEAMVRRHRPSLTEAMA